MSTVRGFVQGMVYVLTFTSAPLYRYPYRNTHEAFRSDWKRIGRDIETSRYGQEGLNTVTRGEDDEYAE